MIDVLIINMSLCWSTIITVGPDPFCIVPRYRWNVLWSKRCFGVFWVCWSDWAR